MTATPTRPHQSLTPTTIPRLTPNVPCTCPSWWGPLRVCYRHGHDHTVTLAAELLRGGDVRGALLLCGEGA